MNDITPFPRRRTPGQQGGKKVSRPFAFAPRDGVKYPSESETIRSTRMPEDPNAKPSWAWALWKCGVEDLWLVIPIYGDDDESKRNDKKAMRAALWRVGTNNGYDLTSEEADGFLYIRVVQ